MAKNNAKVIALSTTWLENNSTTQCNWITTALCDDSTMWLLRQGDSDGREKCAVVARMERK